MPVLRAAWPWACTHRRALVPPPRGGAARALYKRGYYGHSGKQGAREGTVGGLARKDGPEASAVACTCGALLCVCSC